MALIPTWNILSRLHTHYLGGGELEGWLWRYWWFKQLMSSLLAQPTKDWGLIIYTYLCAGNYPETGNVFDWQTFSLALEPVFGDPAYYNVKIILILFLNGLAGYALAKYLTGKPILSILGGAILILNPYVVYEIANGRPRQAMLFSMPLFVMYLIDNYKTLSLKSGLLAGFWLGVSAAVYLFYGMASLMFGLIFIIVMLLTDRKNFTFTFVKYVAVMLIIFVLVSGPFAFRYVEIVLRGEKLPEVTYSRDFPPVEFLLQKNVEVDPRDAWKMSVLRYRSDSPPVFYPFRPTYILNIPLVITLLILIPLLFRRPIPWLWAASAFFFYLLSLGPYLRFGLAEDNYVRIMSGKAVPLLYALFFKYVPFFSRLFAPIRMKGMMYVAISALVVTNLKYLLEPVLKKESEGAPEQPRKAGKLSVFRKIFLPESSLGRLIGNSVIVLLIVFAMAGQMIYAGQIPLTLTEISYPEVYKEIAAKEGNIGVIEIPFRVGDVGNYYQMYHGKKVLWGWTYGSIPQGFPESGAKFLAEVDQIERNSFVVFLEELNRNPAHPPKFREGDLIKLREMGYRYIILHERICDDLDLGEPGEAYDLFYKHLSDVLGEPVMTGQEKKKWRIKEGEGNRDHYRLTVFEIQ